MEQLAVTIPAFCEACGIKKSKAYELISSGDVEAVKIGRRTLVLKASIDALIKRGIEDARRAWNR
ncbi:helix-turn-helix domain-containing protein [Sphingomonas sp.]|uniref:helix-turn-helix domain-containing protein n=1 Tax=Sphingomonas sp. TaxID=28214 RepID=UPI003AFF86E9